MVKRWKWAIVTVFVLAFIGLNSVIASVFSSVEDARDQNISMSNNQSAMHNGNMPSMMSRDKTKTNCHHPL
ncbi:hypothetical protein [Listeria booriae]|uniref:Uncharacterized protein n=1 Tax=Listeria booriae TaxID=1552123 RepID=A0A841XY05_9LIST|nr:hypothetical protein [Listeria booriae]MBC1316540.1 hypothetical protein [Listeria booriae]